VIVGIEPDRLRTGVGLSDAVSAALPHAASIAGSIIERGRQQPLCV
jgi:hypothetical protein